MRKQLKTIQAFLSIEKTMSAQKDGQLKQTKKEVEEAVKNFKVSKEYSDRLMVEYVDGFKLLRKYVIKHHPDLNFSSLDIEEVENEMLASEAEPVNVAAMGVMVEAKEGDVENVAPIADDVNVA